MARYHSTDICNHPDRKVHGANMGPIWDRQDPGEPHVGPMNFAIWAGIPFIPKNNLWLLPLVQDLEKLITCNIITTEVYQICEQSIQCILSYDIAFTSFRLKAVQREMLKKSPQIQIWAESLLEIMGSLADIRQTTK